jgi:GDP/GTP exchange factor required for growth at low temperature
MSLNPPEVASELSPAEASTPPPDENNVSTPPLIPDAPVPEDPQATSVHTSPALPAPLPISQPSPKLLLPLPTSLTGKPGITLAELVADLENAAMITPDIAAAEMVVGGEFT